MYLSLRQIAIYIFAQWAALFFFCCFNFSIIFRFLIDSIIINNRFDNSRFFLFIHFEYLLQIILEKNGSKKILKWNELMITYQWSVQVE